jgi:hypothetical protein
MIVRVRKLSIAAQTKIMKQHDPFIFADLLFGIYQYVRLCHGRIKGLKISKVFLVSLRLFYNLFRVFLPGSICYFLHP